VVDELVSARGTQKADFGATFKFPHVFKAEIDLINKRRRRDPRGAIKLEHEAKDVSGEWIWRPLEDANLIGLAFSGGGIRSAAFCLGVLQALHETGILQRVDYLSTVSGGGYIGCSLTAALETAHEGGRPQDNFPFASRLMEDEPPALQHVRNYSNYLFPDGAMDLLYNAAIYARGLVVNAVLVASVVLAGSGLTLVYYAVRDAQFWPTAAVWHPFGLQHFFLTLSLAVLLVAVGIAWGGRPLAARPSGRKGHPGAMDQTGRLAHHRVFHRRVLRIAAVHPRRDARRPYRTFCCRRGAMGKDPLGDIGACRGGHGFLRQQAWRIRQERHASAQHGRPNQSACHEGRDPCRWAHPSLPGLDGLSRRHLLGHLHRQARGDVRAIDVACGYWTWFRGDGAFSLGSEYPFRRLVVDAA
jgi:Patatin-like phospholipase